MWIAGPTALEQAQQRGYTLTERETSLLADGYRARGTSFVRIAASSRHAAGKRLSGKGGRSLSARTGPVRPIEYAAKITENIRGTQRQHDETQHRLDELIPLPDAPEPEPVESPAPTSSGNESIGAVLEAVHPWA
jgi:hypothetical protein